MIDRSGQQLGNYRVIRLIGHGGFADVYLGEHVYLRTLVAIKVLQTKIASEDDLEGFLREARTIAHLEHSHIIRVRDFGVEGQTPFLVMDYALNGTLRLRHPKGSRLPLPMIVPYVKQVASALQFAHEQKLIHRDVKPENMLLGKNDKVLLSDFGVALTAQSSRYQSTQDVIGTVAYMSPEQIQGRPRPASDQYALAIVVYEWLSGDRPFHGSFTEMCTQHMFAPPPALRLIIPDIAPGVEQVMMIALAKDPKQRFGGVRDFAHALDLASRPLVPRQETGPTRIPPSARQETGPTHVPPVLKQQTGPTRIPPIPQQETGSTRIPPVPARETGPTRVPPAVRQETGPTRVPPAQDTGANMLYPDTSPGGAIALSGMEYGEQAEQNKEVDVWRIDRRRMIAMLTGMALCACLGFIDGWVLPANYSFIPSFVAAVIYGVLFGPLVGLVSGGVGISIYEVADNFAKPNIWNHCVGFTLVGLIAGQAFISTRGRYHSWREFVAAEIFGVVGILVSLGFIFYSNVFILNSPTYDLGAASSDFISHGISFSVACLILLPLVLVAYNRVIGMLRNNS